MRKTEFANEEYYHIYNRGVNKEDVFCNEKDFGRFIMGMREFNNESTYEQRTFVKNRMSQKNSEKELKKGLGPEASEPSPFLSSFSEFDSLLEFLSSLPKLAEFICYCLNPNHYHFILKQLAENGIEKFMHKLGTGYATYFNLKHNHSGHLFQGPFQAKHINTNEYLLWLSGYVNGNPEIHKIAEAENYRWSSYQDYLSKRNGTLCEKEIILSQFGNADEYKKYVEMVIKESGKRKDLKEYFLE